MENFTIHIFGYGETQIISKDLSVKVNTTELTKVKPLVDAIWAKKPEDSEAEEKYHVIHCFNYNDIRWLTKNGFSLNEEESLYPLITELIEELESKKPVEEQEEQEVN